MSPAATIGYRTDQAASRPGTRAAVALSHDGGGLVFTVSDDGRGFDPAAAPPGTGVQGMADRLAALGGTLHLSSVPGRGTQVTGRVPATLEAAPVSSSPGRDVSGGLPAAGAGRTA